MTTDDSFLSSLEVKSDHDKLPVCIVLFSNAYPIYSKRRRKKKRVRILWKMYKSYATFGRLFMAGLVEHPFANFRSRTTLEKAAFFAPFNASEGSCGRSSEAVVAVGGGRGMFSGFFQCCYGDAESRKCCRYEKFPEKVGGHLL
jgi:hypothetical protein